MIKNIIYLDEAKMYSLSSQIFEGITEYMFKEQSLSNENSEEQKGPLASGKMLADAIRSSERSIEKRFLHDHSFSIFESKLIDMDAISDIAEETHSLMPEKAFVRVCAKAKFIDAAKITSIMGSFNEIGEALAYVTQFPRISELKEKIEQMKSASIGNRKNSQIRQQENELSNAIANLGKASGMHQDPKFLECLAKVTRFGFSDQLEVQQKVGANLYSSCLKRDCMREADDLTIRKYSRNTEKKLVVLGIATQTALPAENESLPTQPDDNSMKAAVTHLVDHIANLETSMSGKSANEVVIDPIAVYVTL